MFLNTHKLENSMTYTVISFSMFILSLNSDEPSANPWVELTDKLIRCHGDGEHVIYMAKQLRSTTSLNVEVDECKVAYIKVSSKTVRNIHISNILGAILRNKRSLYLLTSFVSKLTKKKATLIPNYCIMMLQGTEVLMQH